MNISNNNATVSRQVIDAIFGDPGAAGGISQNVHLTMLNNTFVSTGIATSVSNSAIFLETGTELPSLCMNIVGNTATASGTREGVEIFDSFPTANPNVSLEGVGTNAETILNATNTLTAPAFVEHAVVIVPPGTCLTP